MAPLTEDDRTLIGILRIEKDLNAYQMINEFPARNWSKNNLNRLIRQIDASRVCFKKNSSLHIWPENFSTTFFCSRCWTEISQELINGAIDQWARRIDAVIRARGRHIEYLFD